MRCFALGIVAASALLAQQPETQDLLDALARTASLFGRTAPSLGAREVLLQNARRVGMQVLKRGKHNELKDVSFELPETLETHEVVSDYTMGTVGATGFHEIRKTLLIDKVAPSVTDKPRHALTLGLSDPDDETKKQLLESLELERLEGAATDFGPILLLFTGARQRDTRFSSVSMKRSNGETGWSLAFHQTGGAGSLTEFRNSREVKHMPEGQIWFRDADLLPLRITLRTEEVLTPKYILRNEADIQYQPTRFGLAPQTVTHRQYLNEDLLVENRFRYSDYRGIELQP